MKKTACSFPASLEPTSKELFVFENRQVEVPKSEILLEKWTGKPINETFGNKGLVGVNGSPMFAELAILQLFLQDGWKARWIEPYGRAKVNPFCLTEWKDDKYKNQTHCPISETEVLDLLDKIAKENGETYAGCWDVFGWKNGRFLFAEAKRTMKDSLRQTQNKWLLSALKCELNPENFLVVEWDYK